MKRHLLRFLAYIVCSFFNLQETQELQKYPQSDLLDWIPEHRPCAMILVRSHYKAHQIEILQRETHLQTTQDKELIKNLMTGKIPTTN